MGASENPLRQAKTPKKQDLAAEEPLDEVEAAAAKAARKAAKQAKKAAAAAGEAAAVIEEVAVAAVEEQSDEAAAKAARKAERKAARKALAEAEAVAEAAALAKAERKAAKAAKKQADLMQVEAEEAEAKPTKKRKASDEPLAQDTNSSNATADVKQRKLEDGSKVASKVLDVDAFRKAHQIIVASKSCPAPTQTFDEAAPDLGAALTKALKAQGYAAPTPIQAQGWPIALQGKDVVAVAETGSGKTCGFLLPALARIGERGPAPRPKKLSYYHSEPARPTVLVLAPTRELAQQIAVEAHKFAPVVNARVVQVYGGVPKGDQARELKQGCDVLVATPGRLLDFCRGDPERQINPSIELGNVTYLVLDEADRMLDMGFEEDIRTIVDKCPKTGKPEESGGATGLLAGSMRQTLFFTATWPKAIQKTAASLTSTEAVHVRIGQGDEGDKLTANPNVKQVVTVMQEHEKMANLKELLEKQLHKGETAIVFTSQKHICDTVTWELQNSGLGLWCRTIHSGKDQWDRDEALAKFRELTKGSAKGERGVLVATDVASRGLDIPGVAMVVVYDFGRSLQSAQNGGVESYVHRVGRTGRAGKTGYAFTFYTAEDLGATELIEILKGAGQEVPPALEEISWTEDEERWKKENKKSFYKKGGRSKGKGKGKDKAKGKGKGK